MIGCRTGGGLGVDLAVLVQGGRVLWRGRRVRARADS